MYWNAGDRYWSHCWLMEYGMFWRRRMGAWCMGSVGAMWRVSVDPAGRICSTSHPPWVWPRLNQSSQPQLHDSCSIHIFFLNLRSTSGLPTSTDRFYYSRHIWKCMFLAYYWTRERLLYMQSNKIHRVFWVSFIHHVC